MRKRIVVLVLIGMNVLALTGCGKNKELKDINNLPKQEVMSKQEAMDMYAEQTSKESQLSKKYKREQLDMKEVKNTEVINLLKNKVKEIEREQQEISEYSVDKTIHENIKAQIDGLKLNNGSVESINKVMGYYYVTVKYKTGVNTGEAKLKEIANYLGVNGVIIKNETNTGTEIDNQYKDIIDKKIRDGEYENVISSKEEVNSGSNVTGTGLDYCKGTKKLKYNVSKISKELGDSMEQMAFMPDVNMIATVAGTDGELNGYGLFINGKFGLRKYGYDINKENGEMRITYVFKQSIQEASNISYEFCYVSEYTNNIRLESDKEDTVTRNEDGTEKITAYDGIIIPEFVRTELDKLVERADRVINNCYMNGLVGGSIYEDAGLGVKYGLYSENTNIVYFATNIDKVLDRDVEAGVYLVKASRLIEEIVNWSGTTARYRDTYYMVIRQDGKEFKINDEVWVGRELEEIPEADGDVASDRMLIALNLAGDISEENRRQISESLTKLYTASTQRKLYNSEDADGNIEYGMYDCFTDEKDILSEDRLEYLNSQIRSRLLKLGVDTGAIYSGQVVKWIGGNDNQAEVVAEELIEYDGTDRGLYLQSYYLLDNTNGEWEIVDISTIEEREVSGEELAGLKN